MKLDQIHADSPFIVTLTPQFMLPGRDKMFLFSRASNTAAGHT
jgi:hypothetical protein